MGHSKGYFERSETFLTSVIDLCAAKFELINNVCNMWRFQFYSSLPDGTTHRPIHPGRTIPLKSKQRSEKTKVTSLIHPLYFTGSAQNYIAAKLGVL